MYSRLNLSSQVLSSCRLAIDVMCLNYHRLIGQPEDKNKYTLELQRPKSESDKCVITTLKRCSTLEMSGEIHVVQFTYKYAAPLLSPLLKYVIFNPRLLQISSLQQSIMRSNGTQKSSFLYKINYTTSSPRKIVYLHRVISKRDKEKAKCLYDILILYILILI